MKTATICDEKQESPKRMKTDVSVHEARTGMSAASGLNFPVFTELAGKARL